MAGHMEVHRQDLEAPVGEHMHVVLHALSADDQSTEKSATFPSLPTVFIARLPPARCIVASLDGPLK